MDPEDTDAPDPDDPTLMHSSFIAQVTPVAIANAATRAITRRLIARMIEKENAEKGWSAATPLCWHYMTQNDVATVMVHFLVRDELAAKFAGEVAP